MNKFLLKSLLISLMLLGLPLTGIICSGRVISLYLEFPPTTRYVSHAPFSLTVFFGMGTLVFFLILPFLVRLFKHSLKDKSRVIKQAFPWWGYIGILFGTLFWILAWTRFEGFSLFQHHTFTPLWISYIIVVNGASYARSKFCVMLKDPVYFLLLFPASAVFWWFFEYLNRFVQNWYYVEVYRFSPAEYIIFASLSFSTVLPAVLSTAEFLSTFPCFFRIFSGFKKNMVFESKKLWVLLLIFSVTGLSLIGIFPDQLYPLLWILPLIIIVSLQVFSGEPHLFSAPSQGNWSIIVISSLAALICGFLWEMWNYYSLAKWIYSVPYVHRFSLFEMPFLGFAGYLPFGLECTVIGNIIWKRLSRDADACSKTFIFFKQPLKTITTEVKR